MTYFTWSEADTAKLKRIAPNVTKEEAARIIGCSFNSIKSKARRAKIVFKKIGEKHHSSITRDHDVELARALHDEGFTLSQISEKLEMDMNRVNYYVHYRGAI